jgi:F420-dependent oxidoreductase-like protein
LARHAEATGWDGVWIADHFMPNRPDTSHPVLECWSVVAALAAVVPRIRLGALVSGNTYRHPAVLAKIAATLDQVSGGRIVLGLGAAWQENEHRAYGIPFPTTRERLARLDEACQVITRLLSNDLADFKGQYYHLHSAPLEPKPTRLPLLIGGGGERVTARIAARWADEWNVWATPAMARQKARVLERHCLDVGRDPTDIGRSVQALVLISDDEGWLATQRRRWVAAPCIAGGATALQEAIATYSAAGFTEFVVSDATLGEGSLRLESLDWFLAEVAAPFH